jgi:hypothetical protein
MSKKNGPPRAVVGPFVAKFMEGAFWVGPNGLAVASEEEAQRFTLFRSPSVAERARAEMIAHEVAGGLDAWTDLQTGLDRVRSTLRESIRKRLWPEGMPEAKTPEESKKLEEQFAEAWAQDDSDERAYFQQLQGMNDRIEFIARWEVTSGVRDGQDRHVMPREWRELRHREIDNDTFYAIWTAYNEATAGVIAGK